MKISVFRLNYGKGALCAVASSIAQVTVSHARQWPEIKDKRKTILRKPLISILLVIGLGGGAITALKESPGELIKGAGAWLYATVTSGRPPLKNPLALQSPDQLSDEPRRPRVVAIEPLSEHAGGVRVISVEIPRPDGQGFDTEEQWVPFMSRPVYPEKPTIPEPPLPHY